MYNSNLRGICPLTNKPITPNEWCYYGDYDCSDVKVDRYAGYVGEQGYRCDVERIELTKKYNKERENTEFNNSIIMARNIDLDHFFYFCNKLDDAMIKNRQEYTMDLKICPFHTPEQRILVYLFEGDEINEISAVDNIFSFLAKNFDILKNQVPKGYVSLCAVPAELAEAISVCLNLKYKKDTKNILKYENPIYIKSRILAKYINAVYGLKWQEFDKIRRKHLEITEIVNFDNILYLKPELDQIIQREIYTKEQETKKILEG